MNRWLEPRPYGYESMVQLALDEDLSLGDPSGAVLGGGEFCWMLEAQEKGIACGLAIAAELLDADPTTGLSDGDAVEPGRVVISGKGPANQVMALERTALNFVTILSGTTTLTHQFVQAVAGTGARIIDTRKTIPGLRGLQKYAVRCGGGHNHRFNLGDGVMLKDNHIAAAGSIAKAVERARATAHHLLKIEVECEAVEQVSQAISAGVDVILLDNMEVETMAAVIREYKGRALFEASGGVNLRTIRQIAEAGVDVISVGALTHSAPALKFHLEPA